MGYKPQGHEESDTTERLSNNHLWCGKQLCGAEGARLLPGPAPFPLL